MKKMILGCVLSLSVFSALAEVEFKTITSSRAAELATHRVEKLVNLKKIETSFLSKLQSIELEKLNPTSVGEPAFIATASQYAGTDGTKNQVEITLDDQGKALSFKVKSGASAENAPAWPKDATALVENSLHFLLEHGTMHAELKPFYEGLISLKLKKGTVDGQEVVLVQVQAKEVQTVLNIALKLDGTYISYEIK